MGNILHTATSLIPPDEPLIAFENRFSTSEKLFKACSSLSRDRRGWVCMSVLVGKGKGRLTALGLSFSMTAYQALASLISVLSMLHPNKWSKAWVSLWSDISTCQTARCGQTHWLANQWLLPCCSRHWAIVP